ncbi:hypothetical protein E4T42_04732 [Aureobasidium subglaciale]|nr:hypothetical protein E4T42_04732 [Aureobasidium subglaciale]
MTPTAYCTKVLSQSFQGIVQARPPCLATASNFLRTIVDCDSTPNVSSGLIRHDNYLWRALDGARAFANDEELANLQSDLATRTLSQSSDHYGGRPRPEYSRPNKQQRKKCSLASPVTLRREQSSSLVVIPRVWLVQGLYIDYHASNAPTSDSNPTWASIAKVYVWGGEGGDVGPANAELEAHLFEGEHNRADTKGISNNEKNTDVGAAMRSDAHDARHAFHERRPSS